MSGHASRRILGQVGPICLGLVAAAVFAACGSGDGATSPGRVSVLAGLGDRRNGAISVLEYLPESVTVAIGSTVEWRISGPEPHSVTFFPTGRTPPPPGSDPSLFSPAPPPRRGFDGGTLVNSGLAPVGGQPAASFEVTFPAAGTYTYVCVIHPLMTGTVNVVGKGGDAETQAEVDSRAGAELARWLDEGRAAKRALDRSSPRSERAPDGTTTWRIEMGATTDHTDVLAFAPTEAEIRPDDRVVFVNDSGRPHTASFAGRQPLPRDPDSPQVAAPAPGPSPQALDADGFFNTGILPPNAPPGSAPPELARSFTFVVPTAGTYSYVCILHLASGMAASIKVA